MNPRLLLISAFVSWAFAALPALAQQRMAPPPYQAPITVPVAPTATTTVPPPPAEGTQTPSAPVPLPTIAPPNCKPPEYPGSLASNATVTAFNKDYKAYGECIKKYVDDNRAWIAAVVETNNRAVEEYNKYTTDLKKLIDAAKE
jgi:hypothetical protein